MTSGTHGTSPARRSVFGLPNLCNCHSHYDIEIDPPSSVRFLGSLLHSAFAPTLPFYHHTRPSVPPVMHHSQLVCQHVPSVSTSNVHVLETNMTIMISSRLRRVRTHLSSMK